MKIQNAQLTKDQADTPLIMQLKRKHRWIAEYVDGQHINVPCNGLHYKASQN
jgi:hypothetical protein